MSMNDLVRALGGCAALLFLSCDSDMTNNQPAPGSCAKADDCASKVCQAGLCAQASCTDKVKNGSESDVDCGGSCGTCADGLACTAPAGCQSGACSAGRCVPPSCTDKAKNGSESDVDCGGSCGACADGLACTAPAGCQSGICTAGRCTAVSCTDRMKNGSESDVDCGGSCPACTVDAACNGATDCAAGLVCSSNKCQMPRSCRELREMGNVTTDGVQTIDPDGAGAMTPISVFCDMTLDGGGWTRAVNIKGNSVFHLDQTGAVGDVSNASAPAKLSDAVINLLNTVGYFRYNCGTQVNLFVKNTQNMWTSMRTNTLNWSIDRGRDGTFECAANRTGYVFSDFMACSAGHTNYAALNGAMEGNGCYNVTWNLDGNLWVK